eukprot:TRINITY_DN4199_c0_g1_i12.p4 TRINITY_DN4199_c0_g1~~TRINITY_DN4199_c0_g1_i12.p4  ORF type:complete len:105 (-),score=29.91 TRINITY_DN4199_c0_g1_i12:19-333(-)
MLLHQVMLLLAEMMPQLLLQLPHPPWECDLQAVTYKKAAVVEEPSPMYYTKKTQPEPVPVSPSASASATATAGPGGDAAALSYASVSGDDAAAAAQAAASAMGI